MCNSNSSIVTPFFKQLIVDEIKEDFLIEPERSLEFFKFNKGKCVDAKDFRLLKPTLFLKEYREVDSFYPCIFIKENYSWISKSEDGEYRYFSKNTNNGKTFIFDILDLFQIGYKMNYKELLNFFKDNLSIEIKNDFLRFESDKYIDNIKYIEEEEYINSSTKKLIKGKEDIYATLNKIGLENLFSKTLTFKEDAIFFASTSYIQQRLDNKYSIGTINKVVNLFSVAGIINKIREEDIPLEFREGNLRKVQNFTSYYSIPNLKKVMPVVEDRSNKLLEENLFYYNLTKKKVLNLFGENDFNNVYVQKTYDGKSHTEEERYSLMDIFYRIYAEFNYVSKDLFFQQSPKGYSKTFIFQEFDRISKLNGFKVVRPNNRLKKKLGIKTNSNVAIK